MRVESSASCLIGLDNRLAANQAIRTARTSTINPVSSINLFVRLAAASKLSTGVLMINE